MDIDKLNIFGAYTSITILTLSSFAKLTVVFGVGEKEQLLT
jgi:hypothetical protein